MCDNEFRLQREVQELKAEVRRLRRTVEGAFIVVGLVAVLICPQLLVLVAGIAALILFAFLVSPVRRMIFTSIFYKRDSHEYDA
jgi:hypothetical protein